MNLKKNNVSLNGGLLVDAITMYAAAVTTEIQTDEWLDENDLWKILTEINVNQSHSEGTQFKALGRTYFHLFFLPPCVWPFLHLCHTFFFIRTSALSFVNPSSVSPSDLLSLLSRRIDPSFIVFMFAVPTVKKSPVASSVSEIRKKYNYTVLQVVEIVTSLLIF